MKALLLIPVLLAAPSRPFNTAGSGINSAVLLDADGVDVPATSKSVPMESLSEFMNELSWVLDVTWGTSTYMLAKCQVSHDNTNFGWLPYCTDAATAQCEPRVWRFDAADYPNGEINFSIRNPAQWAKCQFWSPAGTGTISAYGNRSKQ